jgi:HEPN domain-containing protein
MARKELELWLNEAKNDFGMGDILLKEHIYNGAVFHFQQAAEKALKAILYLSNIQPWGHSILNLFQEYEKSGHKVSEELKNYARSLDRHYTASRYPDSLPNITPKEAYDRGIALSLRKKTQAIIEFVENEKAKEEEKEKEKGKEGELNE